MGSRSLRQRCLDALGDIDIPDPFDIHQFAERVGELRGREVRLIAKEGAGGPCGVCVPTRATDYVFYEAGTGGFHRDHIVLHELGHLLLEHEADVFWTGHALALLPDLDLDVMTARVLARSNLGGVAEQEAEMIAILVHERVHHRRLWGRSTGPGDELALRMRVTLGTRKRHATCG